MLNNHKPNHNNASVFSVSALPWLTGSTASSSPQRWDFHKVTKFVTVRNNDTTATNGIYLGLTENGVQGTNRFLIPGGASETFDIRCRSLWVLAQANTPAYSIFAGLTVASSNDFPVLTGSIENVSSSLEGEGWDGVG